MKKLFLVLALFLSMGTSTMFAIEALSAKVERVMNVNEFEPIEVKSLPDSVQKVLTTKYAEYQVKEAFVEVKEDGTKAYKVVLLDKEGKEAAVIFNEKGEEV